MLAVVMALLPHLPRTPLDPFGDKVEHATAFGLLAWLGCAGYARMPLFRRGKRLSFLGAVIEVAQSKPALHRDCDILDWFTDTVAVAIILGIVAVVRSRRTKAAERLYPQRVPLNAHQLRISVALAIVIAPAALEAKGCIKGAFVGGVGGHYVGKGHALMGAAAGCAVGRHRAAVAARQRRAVQQQRAAR